MLPAEIDMNDVTIVGTRPLDADGKSFSELPMDIVIRRGVITAVEPSGRTPPIGEVVNGRNTITFPGLINGHHHSHENFHKGRYDRLPLELWMNYVRPAKPLNLTADDVYFRTLIGASQALLSGTTCIVDDLNASPVLCREHIDAALKAYEDIGIRALVGPTLFDVPFHQSVPFLSEVCSPELLKEFSSSRGTPISDYQRFVEELAQNRHPDHHRVGVVLAPSAPQRCTPGLLRWVREFADAARLPVIIHVQETRLQASSAWHERKMTLFRYLDEMQFLAPGTSLIHAVWLTPDDIRRVADSGASIQHNPNSNLKLGSGIMPMRALLDAGVNISLGTDGCGSIESVDMLRVLSSTALVHKLRGNNYKSWVGAEEAFFSATRGGAIALGLGSKLGKIAPGLEADLVLCNLNAPAFTPLNDPLRQLVYGESGVGIRSVLVAGRQVVKDGALALLEQDWISGRVEDAMSRLRPQLIESEAFTEALRPAYEKIWARCLDLPLAPGTFPARMEDC